MKRTERLARSIVRVKEIQKLNIAESPIIRPRRIVGEGKRYCTLHGVAHLDAYQGRCPRCVHAAAKQEADKEALKKKALRATRVED